MDIRYKPAKLANEIDLRVEDDRILQLELSGRVLKEVNITEIQAARWHQMYARPFVTRSLDLVTRRGTMNITQAVSALAGPNDPQLRAYTTGVRASLGALAEARPDLSIELGQPALIRGILFVALLVAGAILTAPAYMVLGHRNADELWWVAALLGACILFCAISAWRAAPWRQLPETPARDLESALSESLQ